MGVVGAGERSSRFPPARRRPRQCRRTPPQRRPMPPSPRLPRAFQRTTSTRPPTRSNTCVGEKTINTEADNPGLRVRNPERCGQIGTATAWRRCGADHELGGGGVGGTSEGAQAVRASAGDAGGMAGAGERNRRIPPS